MSREATTNAVSIVEVAPRDGFQSIAAPLPTEAKLAVIEALLAAGVERLEIGSFVSPKAIPQMGDMREICAKMLARTRSSPVRFCALVPNAKGAERALDNGIREIVYVFSASEAHNLNNVRRTVQESLEELRNVASLLRGERDTVLRLDLATAFDCPFSGPTPTDAVEEALERAWQIDDAMEVALCDTTGRANPAQVHALFLYMMSRAPSGCAWAFHGHDTFGLGVANAFSAHGAGVRVFDGSAAGLGGCPFAPGATGNTATEDLVFAFEEAGIPTGVSLPRLLEAADRVAALPGGCTGGHLRTVPRDRAVRAAGAPGAAG
jgi:hydroxymethylglutaryl-CoA lyase